MKILIGEYLLLMTVCLFEGNFGKALYWSGAVLLSTGVLLMK